MPRSVTVSDIIARARLHADMVNSQFVSDSEALDLFNEVVTELYDALVGIDDDYFSIETSFTVTSGTTSYPLPDDFYKLVLVSFATTPGDNAQRITLRPYNNAERNNQFVQSTNIPSGTVYLRYVPVCPIYTDITQTVDGVNGWDRLISLRLAQDFLDKEESNTSAIERKFQERWTQMQNMLERDLGMPSTVVDVTQQTNYTIYNNMKYHLYAGSIDFVSTELLGTAIFGGPFL